MNKNNNSIKKIIKKYHKFLGFILIFVFLAIGLVSSTILVQKNQNLQQYASGQGAIVGYHASATPPEFHPNRITEIAIKDSGLAYSRVITNNNPEKWKPYQFPPGYPVGKITGVAMTSESGTTIHYLAINGEVWSSAPNNGEWIKLLYPENISDLSIFFRTDGTTSFTIVKGGKVLKTNNLAFPWNDVTSTYSGVGSGTITGYNAYIKPDGNLSETLIRNGKVWKRWQNNGAWGEWQAWNLDLP